MAGAVLGPIQPFGQIVGNAAREHENIHMVIVYSYYTNARVHAYVCVHTVSQSRQHLPLRILATTLELFGINANYNQEMVQATWIELDITDRLLSVLYPCSQRCSAPSCPQAQAAGSSLSPQPCCCRRSTSASAPFPCLGRARR